MIDSKYTTVLKNLLDNPETKEAIDKALSTYPLYERKSKQEFIPCYIPTREELNNKILNHYKYREIGFETVGRFLDELETTMIEIMPPYNQLFFTQDQDFNILFNVDYSRKTERDLNNITSTTDNVKTEGTEETNATSSSTGTNTSSATDSTTTTADIENYNKNVKSATPQSSLNIGETEINNLQYADEMYFNKDKNSDKGTSTGTSSAESNSTLDGTNTNESSTTQTTDSTSNGENKENETILETTKGNFGVVSSQDLISKYRELIINVEQQIINDERVAELFMRVF